MIASNFASLSTPHEVTQYLRGKFYIYIDFLLSNEYKDPEKEIVPVAEYLVLVVRLVAIWLGRFPDLLKSVSYKRYYNVAHSSPSGRPVPNSSSWTATWPLLPVASSFSTYSSGSSVCVPERSSSSPYGGSRLIIA